jgi:hypothetical protein
MTQPTPQQLNSRKQFVHTDHCVAVSDLKEGLWFWWKDDPVQVKDLVNLDSLTAMTGEQTISLEVWVPHMKMCMSVPVAAATFVELAVKESPFRVKTLSTPEQQKVTREMPAVKLDTLKNISDPRIIILSDALNLALRCNLIPAISGEPCRKAFDLAEALSKDMPLPAVSYAVRRTTDQDTAGEVMADRYNCTWDGYSLKKRDEGQS